MPPRRLAPLLLPLLLVAAHLGCDSAPAPSPSGLPTVEMKLGTRTYKLEVAATDADRQKGLMQRDTMPEDHGMIFVFPDEAERAFWMKNTRIPLDILYIAADGRVVSIKQMKPYDLNTTPSDGPAKWAIELNKGQAAVAGVKPGDVLTIPQAARDAKE